MILRKEEITEWFKELQDSICSALEKTDGQERFTEELWERPGGGGGRSRVIQNGKVIEKGGVNFSAVHGEIPDFLKKENSAGTSFYATGVSIVLHPVSPRVPIIHMNTRYFETGNGEYWFGGGIDLTPHYVDSNDVLFFHSALKRVCDQFDHAYYPKFKQWADDYFYIPHRNETRGVGGIFFDRLKASDKHSKRDLFEFVKAVGKAFAPIYVELVNRSRDKVYGEREKQWQLIRRGRYAEFNLVYDKGTKFGLETNGRIESILMSLPPLASWIYNYIPERGSEEEKTLHYLSSNRGSTII